MTADKNEQRGYASVNGIDLYYEVHGGGEPLIVLPGGFMTVEAMGPIIPRLAETRRVIAVELQGHGHTADSERPLSYEAMADDIAALIGYLGLQRADILGYSLGGAVALHTAIRHPEDVRKVVLISTPCKRGGWYPEVLAGMASISVEGFSGTPVEQTNLAVSPTPDRWPQFVAKVRSLLSEDYDWTDSVRGLKAPVFIIGGDADSVRLAHAVEFFQLLGGGHGDGDMGSLSPSRLAVLPATTHVGWAPPKRGIMSRADLLAPMISEFLDAPMAS